MGPDTYWLSVPYIKLQRANYGFIVSVFMSFLFALTHFPSSAIPLLLSPSLRRFAIITDVTQSKTVKLKLPPSLPCLSALPWFLLCPCCDENLVRRTRKEKKKKIQAQKKPEMWGHDTCTAETSDILPDKSRHSEYTCRTWTISFLFPAAVSFLLFPSRTAERPTAPAEQLSGQQNRSPWL